MNKKILSLLIGIGIFTTGVFSGKQIQKVSIKKKTLYAGTIQMYEADGTLQAYLVLNMPTDELATASNVIFEVIKKREPK